MRRKIAMTKKKAEAEKASCGKKSVDLTKLKSLLEKGGVNAVELTKELGGVTRLALKNAILKVVLEANKVYDVEGLYGKGGGNIKFGELGIRIPAKRLSKTFKQGDEFSLKVEKNAIVLNKV